MLGCVREACATPYLHSLGALAQLTDGILRRIRAWWVELWALSRAFGNIVSCPCLYGVTDELAIRLCMGSILSMRMKCNLDLQMTSGLPGFVSKA